ncbi:MAG: hybrid sensor histidine kinase/response regulator [Burkholderiaceae bacterium]
MGSAATPPALPPTAGQVPMAVLLVDDEPQACKWFSRLFADEFTVLTAEGVDQALALVEARSQEIAVVMTDYRMPGRNGVELLKEIRNAYPHISRLLISAYADKAVAMDAINQGQVEQILEKPLNEPLIRQALRTALRNSQRRVADRHLIDSREFTLRETLGFLAHEASAPLATVRSYLAAMKDRHMDSPGGGTPEPPQRRKSGEVLAMIETAQRGADFAQALITNFLKSAHATGQGDHADSTKASDLILSVRQQYPFDADEARWVRCEVSEDFDLPGSRDLLFLVLCTLVKNAVLALRSSPPPEPMLEMVLARSAAAPGRPTQPLIGVRDNGPGISPEILDRLSREATTSSDIDGTGMGLVFCQRVMTTLGGTMGVQSTLGEGAVVSLYFPNACDEPHKERL